ncbi:NACHT N-terminal Helical domain 1-containing protein [Actinoplanes derwentensis]|uniref:NACHT domain-containing protein n=1 Tax=Actinoplanes derwentensis TaxID=113562 RepID=A0A1H2DDG6_9ACTN|nr:NACHT domain-containing protein [Actinoplanes derwentensis]GID90535.1 hypothetical protein Ade03nite_94590 [Actinoplanes derwentensis]SDT80624.1 NACHT domain-containing protein [Actinoplanes derwentensis]
MSRVSKATKLRIADVVVKTVGALIPGPVGTLAGELASWSVGAQFALAPERELTIQIGEAADTVSKRALRHLETTFPGDAEAAAAMVALTMESVNIQLDNLVDVGLSARRLNDLYLTGAPPGWEDELGDAGGAYRMLLAEVCYRMEALFLGNSYVHGRILRELLERRRTEDVGLFRRKTEWDDDEFTWNYRFEARELMPRLATTTPSGTRIEIPLDAVFQEPRGELDGTRGRIFELFDAGRGWIVRGPAGAGKSFLLRCLALKTMVGGLPTALADWHGRVPLYLDLTDGLEPVPAEALARFDGRLASRAPKGWEERLIQSGKALLLLDNIDGHPGLNKLTRLISDGLAAGCVVIVNARSAVPAAWTAELGLREIRLMEMSPLEIDRFLIRWHEAVAEECSTEEERHAVRAARDELLMAVGRCIDIRRLCASPILLTQFCREFLAGALTLPADRADLVERVLQGTSGKDLLDTGAPVPDDDWDDLLELAHCSVQNDLEFTTTQAATWLGVPTDRIGELTHRHRLLRAENPDRLAFAQDGVRAALAARFRAQRQFIGDLAAAATVRDKREAVVAAAACLPRSAASELLRRLVAAGHPGVARAALHVMRQVETDAREATLAGTAELIPPSTPEQVARVVKVGICLLDLLTQQEPVDPHTATAVLELAGPGDIAAVATVAARAEVATQRMMLEAWDDHGQQAALNEMIRYREGRS